LKKSVFALGAGPVLERAQREKAIFAHFQRGNHRTVAMKKQQIRGEKLIFRLEKRMFSSSIRNASVEAVLRW
jgi:hypothetical protein